jgi:hypothetical protein
MMRRGVVEMANTMGFGPAEESAGDGADGILTATDEG